MRVHKCNLCERIDESEMSGFYDEPYCNDCNMRLLKMKDEIYKQVKDRLNKAYDKTTSNQVELFEFCQFIWENTNRRDAFEELFGINGIEMMSRVIT